MTRRSSTFREARNEVTPVWDEPQSPDITIPDHEVRALHSMYRAMLWFVAGLVVIFGGTSVTLTVFVWNAIAGGAK